MIKEQQLFDILYDSLQVNQEHTKLTTQTQLLGALPEFDSMAVLSVLTELEQNFGLEFDDDELSGKIFESVGSLLDFINNKIS